MVADPTALLVEIRVLSHREDIVHPELLLGMGDLLEYVPAINVLSSCAVG
jgi:hypothetical protein